MEDLEILELAISVTGVERFRFLCLEHENPAVRAENWKLVRELAKREPGKQIKQTGARPKVASDCGGCGPSGPQVVRKIEREHEQTS